MTANGSRVTQKQLYDTVLAVDEKLSKKIDTVLAAVSENRIANAGEFASLNEGLNGKGGLKDRVHTLETSETKWRALTAVVIAGAGAFFGWLTGRS